MDEQQELTSKKIIIDRTKHAKGSRSDKNGIHINNYLIGREDGMMCCLGFRGLQYEIPEEYLLGKAMPFVMSRSYIHEHRDNKYIATCIKNNSNELTIVDSPYIPSEATTLAASINDCPVGVWVYNRIRRLDSPTLYRTYKDFPTLLNDKLMTEELRESMLIAIFKKEWNEDLEFIN